MGKRECGDCRLCCKLLPVYEIGSEPEPYKFVKHGAEWCPHAGPQGCAIYNDPTKPLSCATFRCLWLKDFLPDELHPRRIHAVFSIQVRDLGYANGQTLGESLVLVVAADRPKVLKRREVQQAIVYVMNALPDLAGWMYVPPGERHPTYVQWRDGSEGRVQTDWNAPPSFCDGDADRRMIQALTGGRVPTGHIDFDELMAEARARGMTDEQIAAVGLDHPGLAKVANFS